MTGKRYTMTRPRRSSSRPLRKKRGKNSGHKTKLPVEHNGLFPYVARYLEWLLVKGFAQRTNEVRDHHLRLFVQWCDERDLHDPRFITKPILERYQRYLYYYRKPDGHPLGFSTQQQRLTSLKAWFKWLTQENYLASNPASEVQTIRVPKKLPSTLLSVEDVQRVLNSIDVDTLEGLRNRAILEVLYSTGIRRAELCQLSLGDLNASARSLFVRQGKGAKDRCIPIGERALYWVQRYQDEVRPQLDTYMAGDALFLNVYGEPVSSSQLGDIVKPILRKAGIDGEGCCHLFRHAMASHMLENGAELRYIQAMLGHANINTTTVYTHTNISMLRHVHDNTHPLKAQRF